MRLPKTEFQDSTYVFKGRVYHEPVAPLDDISAYSLVRYDDDKTFTQPLVYTFYDRAKHPLYVGKSMCFANRLSQHEMKSKFYPDVAYIGLQIVGSAFDMDILEVHEIHKKRPKYNSDCNNDVPQYVTLVVPVGEIKIKSTIPELIFTADTISSVFFKDESYDFVRFLQKEKE